MSIYRTVPWGHDRQHGQERSMSCSILAQPGWMSPHVDKALFMTVLGPTLRLSCVHLRILLQKLSAVRTFLYTLAVVLDHFLCLCCLWSFKFMRRRKGRHPERHNFSSIRSNRYRPSSHVSPSTTDCLACLTWSLFPRSMRRLATEHLLSG